MHTVVVNGRVVKYDHQLVGADLGKARQVIEQTVDYLQGELGPDAWNEGMHPEIPEARVLENPAYTYTDPGPRPGLMRIGATSGVDDAGDGQPGSTPALERRRAGRWVRRSSSAR